MKTLKFVLCVIMLVFLSSCATQYKIVSRSEVETSEKKEIVIKRTPFIAFEEVIERSPNVKSVTRITDFKGEKEPGFYSISPKSPYLVFEALEEINNSKAINLWKTSTTGGVGITRLTAGRYFDMEPSFTENGQSILFSSNRSSQTPKLFKVSVASASGITRITQSQSEDRSPSADTQEDRIFYMSKPSSSYNWQIWNINSDGSLPTQIKEGVWPKISHDGKKITYCAKNPRTKKYKIWVMNSDGTGQTQLSMDTDCDDLYPNWSPNDNVIVYSSDIGKDSNGKKNFDIWLMSANGSNKTQLTTNGSTDLMPAFSPDSRYIYFLSNRGFNWDIWRMKIR